MYKLFLKSFALLSGLSALIFTGCNKVGSTDQSSGKTGIVTFCMTTPVFNVYTKSADKLHEDGTTSDKFAIYQFSEDNQFERRYLTDYSAMKPEGSTKLTYDLFIGRYIGVRKFVIIRSSNADVFPALELGDTMQELLDAKTLDSKGGQVYPTVMSSSSTDGNAWIEVGATADSRD